MSQNRVVDTNHSEWSLWAWSCLRVRLRARVREKSETVSRCSYGSLHVRRPAHFMHEPMHAVSITSHMLVLYHDKLDLRLAGALRLKTCARRVPEFGQIGCRRTVSGRAPLKLGTLVRTVCQS